MEEVSTTKNYSVPLGYLAMSLDQSQTNQSPPPPTWPPLLALVKKALPCPSRLLVSSSSSSYVGPTSPAPSSSPSSLPPPCAPPSWPTSNYSSTRDDELGILIDESSNGSSYYADTNDSIFNGGRSGNENLGDQLLKPQIIRQVPRLMRNHENNKGMFDPKVVSIGPYHHGKTKLQFVENLKPMVAKLFVSDSAISDLNEFESKVFEKVDVFRSCYADGSTNEYTDEEFAKMMLLDGCFILSKVDSYYCGDGPESKYNDVITHLSKLVWHSTLDDILYLFENQLPFQVLKLLLSLKFKDGEGMQRIHKFLDFDISWDLQFLFKKEEKATEFEQEPLHLLQWLRTKYIQHQRLSNVTSHKGKNSPVSYDLKDYIHSFRSVTELKAKGIHFRPSCPSSLKAINFKSFCFYGQLNLPPIIVTTYTKTLFSNMIAYELCSGTPEDPEITCYIGFMKSLVDNPNDVKELRSKHVLFNRLGSDEEVANIFKEITTYGYDGFDAYEEVKQSIQDHYNSTGKKLMAEFIHKYFSRPWTVIAFIAATSLLVLAFLQTYYTMSPLSGHN